jgi:uncharacterized protein
MHVDWWIVALAALGHGCLVVWLTNVSHSLGLSERSTGRIVAAIGAVWLVATIALIWGIAGTVAWQSWPAPVQGYALLCLAIALVGLPLSTWRLNVRRLPAGISGRDTQRTLAGTGGAESLIGAGKYAWMLRLPGSDFPRLQQLDWQVALAGLPRSCEGLSIMQVSDLHFAPCFDKRYFEAVLDAAAAGPADLVVFTGDLIDDASVIPWIEPLMARLRGRLGTFAILGNHDYIFDVPAIRRALENAGFTNLDGPWTTLSLGDSTVALGGTSAPWGPALDFAGAPEADLRIILSHTPDYFPRASEHGIDLVLAGHNHGGQVRVPIVGPIFMPSRYGRRYDRGFFRQGRSLMYVSQGVAGKHPVRYGCVPEITRFVLHATRRTEFALTALRSESFQDVS